MTRSSDDRTFEELSNFLTTLLSGSPRKEHHERSLHILRLYGIANGGPIPEGFTADAQIVQEMVQDYIRSAIRAMDIGNYLGAREQLQRALRLLALVDDEQTRIFAQELLERIQRELQKTLRLSLDGELPDTR